MTKDDLVAQYRKGLNNNKTAFAAFGEETSDKVIDFMCNCYLVGVDQAANTRQNVMDAGKGWSEEMFQTSMVCLMQGLEDARQVIILADGDWPDTIL